LALAVAAELAEDAADLELSRGVAMRSVSLTRNLSQNPPPEELNTSPRPPEG
jgi:hypothetical protein